MRVADSAPGDKRAERLEHQLDAIGRATVAIAAERSLPRLLQRIVAAARELTDARDGALAVAGASGALAEANAQRQRLLSLVINAQEERRRRARDLHDATAQALTALRVRLRLRARQAVTDEITTGLLEVLDLTPQALDGVRRMALDLRPNAVLST